MAECSSKLVINTPKGRFEVPCGRCLCCRKRKAAVIKHFCELEQQKYYKQGLSCSFNCITYNVANTPLSEKTGLPTLRKEDYQKFFMRFRMHLKRAKYKAPFSYIGCGEYGEDELPHYHFIFFGLSDYLADSFIRSSWMSKKTHLPIGRIDVRPLIAGGISYVCDYVMTALNGDYAKKRYDDRGIERPFMTHSKGLGVSYLLDNMDILQDNNFIDDYSGKPFLIPKYYRDYYNLDLSNSFDYTQVLKHIQIQAKKNGLSVSDYQRQQSYIASKNALLDSQEAHVPVENELLDHRVFNPNLAHNLAEKLKDDIIPF